MKRISTAGALVVALILAVLGSAAPAGAAISSWSQQSDFSPAASQAAAAAPGPFSSSGWNDVAGSQWSSNSSGYLQQAVNSGSPWNTALLLHNAAGELSANQQVRVRFTATGSANNLWVCLRCSTIGGNTTGYIIEPNTYSGGVNVTLAKVVAGAESSIGSGTTTSTGLASGSDYYFVASAVQNAGGVTTITGSVTSLDGATVYYSKSFTDSTAGLQNTTGAIGIFEYFSSGSGVLVKELTTYLPSTLATSLSFSGATAGSVGSAATLTATANAPLDSAVTLTPSDGGAGGTFTPSTVTMYGADAPAASFTYSPSSTGARSLSITNSGGLANPAMASFQATAAFALSTDWTPSGGPIAAGAAGSTLGGGWIDAAGGVYSVTSGNQVQASPTAQNAYTTPLVRPAAEALVDGRVRLKFTWGSGTSANAEELYVGLRSTMTAAGGVNAAYVLGVQATKLTEGAIVGTTYTQGQTTGALGASLATGVTYCLIASAQQLNGSSTQLQATLYQSDCATQVGTLAVADTTAALQGGAGVAAVFNYLSQTTNSSSLISELTTYNDLGAATSYTLSCPSVDNLPAPATCTVQANGTLASAVTVTPSDGAGGTFSPGSVALGPSSYTQASASFGYTAAGAGQKSVSTTNSGSLANPGAAAVLAQTTTTIPVSSAAFHFSPFNWAGDSASCPGSQPYRCGSAYRRSWNNGAYLTVTWTASSSPTATLLLPTSATSNMLTYFLNGVQADNVPASGPISLSGVIPGASNTLRVVLRNSTQAARWNQACGGGGNNVCVEGLQVDSGSTAGVAAIPLHNGVYSPVLIVGDSITEGIQANFGHDDHLLDYSYYLGQALLAQGYDYGISAQGYSDFNHTGDGNPGDVPAYYLVSGGVYSEPSSRWDKIDQGVSLLDSIGHLSAYGATGQEPAAIYVNYSTNDALVGLSTSDHQAAVTGWIGAARGAAPQAEIMLQMPFGLEYAGKYSQTYVAALRQGVASYQAQAPSDARVALIDLGSALAATLQSSPPGLLINTDTTHPNANGHGLIVPQVERSVIQLLQPPFAGPYVYH